MVYCTKPVSINGVRMARMDLQNVRGFTPPGNFIFTELYLQETILNYTKSLTL